MPIARSVCDCQHNISVPIGCRHAAFYIAKEILIRNEREDFAAINEGALAN